jgi:hypothetical protein
MSKIIFILLFLSVCCVAQNTCSPLAIPLGTKRDSALAKLKEQACKLKLDEAMQDGLQDDLVFPTTHDTEFEYFELISMDGKLSAVWSYTPYFESAQKAFDALFSVLVLNSKIDSGKGGDVLGQRHFVGEVLLQRPPSTGDPSIHFDLSDGAVILESRNKEKGVRIARVRNH